MPTTGASRWWNVEGVMSNDLPAVAPLTVSVPAPMQQIGAWQRLRKVYFGTPGNALLTLLISGVLLLALPPLLRWGVINAVWFDPDPASCRAASGACWNFIWAKLGQLLLGIYPFEQRWRPSVVCVLILGLLVWSVRPASWRGRLGVLWVVPWRRCSG